MRRALADLRGAEGELLTARDAILARAWTVGAELSALRAELPRRNWRFWLRANLRELGGCDATIDRNASRFLAFHRAIPNGRNSTDFDNDSVRKLMWGYVPAKERPQLLGDERLERIFHHLTFVNVFSRWDRRITIGIDSPPTREQLRLDLRPTIKRLAQLVGPDWMREQIG